MKASSFLVGLAVVLASCGPPPEAGSGRGRSHSDDLPPMLPPLKSEDLAPGEGAEAKKGDRVLVHYTGTLLDGTKFDSSLDRGQPFEFVIGKGSVIAGWDLGVVGMKKGGKRKLTIPPHLAYGSRGSPPRIGPDATLVFQIELVDLPDAPEAPPAPSSSAAPEPSGSAASPSLGFERCDPEHRPEMCTKEFRPVCGEVDNGVRCVKAPCPSTDKKPFGNACEACANPKTTGYWPAPCDRLNGVSSP